MPLSLLRLSAECLKILLNFSSVIASHSFVEILRIPGKGVNSSSVVGFEKRFQGQTSWQISQPNAQFSNLPFISLGISISFNSIVKYEMHLLPSTILPGKIASVGQASIQRVQEP